MHGSFEFGSGTRIAHIHHRVIPDERPTGALTTTSDGGS